MLAPSSRPPAESPRYAGRHDRHRALPGATAWPPSPTTVTVLDTWYPEPALGAAPADADPHAVPAELAALRRHRPGARRPHRGGRTVEIDLDAPPADAADAYLRLHLLSHRLVAARTASTSTASSACCPTWCGPTPGPCAVEGFERDPAARCAQPRPRCTVFGVDKFPRMTDYVVPVRGADRRRRPGPARRAPGRGHHGHARGLRATSTPARWAPRWSRAGSRPAWSSATAPTSAAARRSWARCPAAAREVVSHRRALPARRQRRHRHLARRRLRRRGRALRHRRHQGHAAATAGVVKATRAVRRVGPAVPPQLRHRRASRPRPRTGHGIELNAALHAND